MKILKKIWRSPGIFILVMGFVISSFMLANGHQSHLERGLTTFTASCIAVLAIVAFILFEVQAILHGSYVSEREYEEN